MSINSVHDAKALAEAYIAFVQAVDLIPDLSKEERLSASARAFTATTGVEFYTLFGINTPEEKERMEQEEDEMFSLDEVGYPLSREEIVAAMQAMGMADKRGPNGALRPTIAAANEARYYPRLRFSPQHGWVTSYDVKWSDSAINSVVNFYRRRGILKDVRASKNPEVWTEEHVRLTPLEAKEAMFKC